MEASNVQQNFYDNLGNRDYDCFRDSDTKYLKLKIAYTLYGPPTKVGVLNNISSDFTADQCYDKQQNAKINGIVATIKTYSKYNENQDETNVSFLFNCCEPLKKPKTSDNGADISCYPVYRVRKCTGSPRGNCCVFVDDQRRVYKSWQDYLATNKIPKGRMCVPQDGRYQADENNQTAATALLGVNVANLAVNGCNAANSAYSVISDLVHKQNPSALDVMHLTTTVLFFGNAVINFKSAHGIYKQSQTRSLADLVQSQKDNLWQRAKRVFFDADVTTYEQNATVKEVTTNEEFYLSSLAPVLPDRQLPVFKSTETMIQTLIDLQPTISFGYMLIKNRDNVCAVVRIILSRFEFDIQEKLLTLVNWLIGQVIVDAYAGLKKIFPDSELYVVIANYVINFLKFNVTALEIEYQSKRSAAKDDLQLNDAEYDEVCAGFSANWERMTYFFKICVLKMFTSRGKVEEVICKEMVRFFWDWMADQLLKYVAKREQKAKNCVRKKVSCNICEGFYFQ